MNYERVVRSITAILGTQSGVHLRLIALLLMISTMFAADPTPQEIINCWATMSGNKAGKVVFFRTVSGSSKICVMDLKTGLAKEIATHRDGCLKWSPDGKRIATQNGTGIDVLNADGSNLKTIWKGDCGGDQYACNWQDNNHVVYSKNTKISSTEVVEDNSPGTTTDIWTRTPDGPYNCVQISGDYVGFNEYEANMPTGGAHRPVMANWKTGVFHEMVDRDEDGCTVRMKPGGTGVMTFNKWNHKSPARIMNFNKVLIDSMPPVPGYQIGFMQWANDSNFMIHADVDMKDGYTWIRDCKTKSYCFLGTTVAWPDLWVEQATNGITIEEPNAQSKLTIGDTMRVRWTYTGGTGRPVVLVLSVDSGKSFDYPLFDRQYFHKSEQGDTSWAIPLDTVYAAKKAVLRIYDYNTLLKMSAVSEGFVINKKATAIQGASYDNPATGRLRIFKDKILFDPAGDRNARPMISLCSISGKLLARETLTGNNQTFVLPSTVGAGIYILMAHDPGSCVRWKRIVSLVR
jgi:hypothetical protein